jgi:hypothetical protein
MAKFGTASHLTYLFPDIFTIFADSNKQLLQTGNTPTIFDANAQKITRKNKY